MSNLIKRLASLAVAGCVLGVSGSARAATFTVSANSTNLTFNPATVTIDVGDTVQWTNLAVPPVHNVVQISESDWNANNGNNPLPGGFNSGPAGSVSTFSRTFNTAGTFFYTCQPHDINGMKGRVIVNTPPTPTPTPIPTLTGWGLIGFAGLILVVGGTLLARRRLA